MRPTLNFGSRRGQSIILVVVVMSILLLTALAILIDGGQMYAQQQMAQAAADAAAQAGIMSILDGTNATSAYPFGTDPPISPSACTTTDGRTPCVYARDNGFGGAASDTVTLSFPASVSGANLAPVPVPALEVTVQRTLPTIIGGIAAVNISAKAISGITGIVSPDSIFVLDPSAKDAFQVTGAAVLTVSGGGIAINSSNAEAGLIKGSSTVTAGQITSVGGVAIKGTATSSPTPVTGAAAVADPFVSLPALTPGSCAAHPTTYSPPNGTVLQQGTYCGGISVSGIANVTFSAGQYIINGGGLSFGNSAVATGSGVIFYLTGTNATYGSVTASGDSIVTLSAPTSGTYLGVLFYQDRTITSSNDASFGNSASVTLTGSLYFPTTGVTFSGAAATASDMAVIADKVTVAGSANITYDATGLKTGLISLRGVALVQ